jgi:phosphatidylethanolamine-binding protein (PEBP) family uncharacterized protein
MHRAPRWLGLPLAASAIAAAALAACSSTSTDTTSGATNPSSTTTSTTAAASGASVSGSTAPTSTAGFKLTSSAFTEGQPIPQMYTCTGQGGSPPLAWSGVPDGTKSLDLVVVDPDAPVANGFTHWVAPNIDPSTTSLPAGSKGYTPPCPPSGTHHYIFTLYAFGEAPPGTDRAAIEGAGNELGKAVLTGTVAHQ